MKNISSPLLILLVFYQDNARAWVLLEKSCIRFSSHSKQSTSLNASAGRDLGTSDDDIEPSRKTPLNDLFENDSNIVAAFHRNSNHAPLIDSTQFDHQNAAQNLLRLLPETNDSILFDSCKGDECEVEQCEIPDRFKETSNDSSVGDVMSFLGIRRAEPLKSGTKRVIRIETFDDWS
mmetsp:Transcript_5039/g.5722  ORF Transcript_5039/g.5722 Transcript_5039/m.5722 type:complete len:177 (+) Transcript_5039:97-627(+)